MWLLSLVRSRDYCSELLDSRSRCSFCGARRRALINQLLTYDFVSTYFEHMGGPWNYKLTARCRYLRDARRSTHVDLYDIEYMTITYLVQGQVCHSAKFHFLVLRRIRGRAVGSKPLFQHISGLLWKIAATLAVECIVINADVLLETDIVVTLFISCRWRSSVLLVVIH